MDNINWVEVIGGAVIEIVGCLLIEKIIQWQLWLCL